MNIKLLKVGNILVAKACSPLVSKLCAGLADGVDSNGKYYILACKIGCAVVLGEGKVKISGLARFGSDESVLEAINI